LFVTNIALAMDFPGFAESPTTLLEQLWYIHFGNIKLQLGSHTA